MAGEGWGEGPVAMGGEGPVLRGRWVVLEPLAHRHLDGLAAASAIDPTLYRWSPVPQGRDAVKTYIETALAAKDAGSAVPFAIVRAPDGLALGSTRFFDLERWPWPDGHPSHGRGVPDAGEIGYSWLSAAAIRTAANTEAKLLLLTHAFETWRMLRICFHTDARNLRSQAALARIGGRHEGLLRSHRLAADHIARDSMRYSILAAEWPEVKQRLLDRLAKG